MSQSSSKKGIGLRVSGKVVEREFGYGFFIEVRAGLDDIPDLGSECLSMDFPTTYEQESDAHAALEAEAKIVLALVTDAVAAKGGKATFTRDMVTRPVQS